MPLPWVCKEQVRPGHEGHCRFHCLVLRFEGKRRVVTESALATVGSPEIRRAGYRRRRSRLKCPHFRGLNARFWPASQQG
jgi:hypothetical protein